MSNSLFWFRNDLRLADNPGLSAAASEGKLLCVYIFDDADKRGAASKAWLHHALDDLHKNLHNIGASLVLARGDSAQILHKLIADHKIESVHWNRHYEPWMVERDTKIKEQLRAHNVRVKSHKGSVLTEPWAVTTKGGTPFRVFTPFYKACLTLGLDGPAPDLPGTIDSFTSVKGLSLTDLNLLPAGPRWDKSMIENWNISEDGAHKRLEAFIDEASPRYKEERDIPGVEGTSRLSPYLHFGQISPGQIVRRLDHDGGHHAAFIRELYWREFSIHLLFYNPDLPRQPLQPQFAAMPWLKNDEALARWQAGLTGYPIVDAGMRQLWATGWMHNRVRMIVASFLVKHMLQNWTAGEAWFWDCLVDADLANNSASWQWVAGCGADAAPYFRVFNPILQGKKFDPDGHYVREWVPEIAALPNGLIHTPWLSDEKTGYPPPVVEHEVGRQRALDAYQKIKKAA